MPLKTDDMQRWQVELRMYIQKAQRRFKQANMFDVYESEVKATLDDPAASASSPLDSLTLQTLDAQAARKLAAFLDHLVGKCSRADQHNMLQDAIRSSLSKSRRESVLLNNSSPDGNRLGNIEPMCFFCGSDLKQPAPLDCHGWVYEDLQQGRQIDDATTGADDNPHIEALTAAAYDGQQVDPQPTSVLTPPPSSGLPTPDPFPQFNDHQPQSQFEKEKEQQQQQRSLQNLAQQRRNQEQEVPPVVRPPTARPSTRSGPSATASSTPHHGTRAPSTETMQVPCSPIRRNRRKGLPARQLFRNTSTASIQSNGSSSSSSSYQDSLTHIPATRHVSGIDQIASNLRQSNAPPTVTSAATMTPSTPATENNENRPSSSPRNRQTLAHDMTTPQRQSDETTSSAVSPSSNSTSDDPSVTNRLLIDASRSASQSALERTLRAADGSTTPPYPPPLSSQASNESPESVRRRLRQQINESLKEFTGFMQMSSQLGPSCQVSQPPEDDHEDSMRSWFENENSQPLNAAAAETETEPAPTNQQPSVKKQKLDIRLVKQQSDTKQQHLLTNNKNESNGAPLQATRSMSRNSRQQSAQANIKASSSQQGRALLKTRPKRGSSASQPSAHQPVAKHLRAG